MMKIQEPIIKIWVDFKVRKKWIECSETRKHGKGFNIADWNSALETVKYSDGAGKLNPSYGRQTKDTFSECRKTEKRVWQLKL